MPRIGWSVRDDGRVVTEGLIAEQRAVLVESCREEADPTLEAVIDRHAHGRGIPPVAVRVLEGAAMPCTGDEATRLGGEGAVG